jgi:acetyl-CoA carboxylase biotin carboxylase subunit
MIQKILIANRGEIALRVIRACRELGIKTLAVYSEADVQSLHVQLADEAICIGGPKSSDSYLRADRIISAAEIADVDAIHPGYGFLSENAKFAEQCESCNIKFIGPKSKSIRMMGDKAVAKETVRKAGVPIVPGSDGPVESEADAVKVARKIGYPVIIKAVAGGGGRGMRIAHNDVSFAKEYHVARNEAEKAFGNGSVYIEKYIQNPRHIEFQILADSHGKVLHLGERDCSVQRRHQKVAEESPSPGVGPDLRARMLAAAVRAGEAVGYRGAGTVECLVDAAAQDFVFLEMNTRLQVEHPVTEMVTGVDLVEAQLRVACGEAPGFDPAAVTVTGHAIELRVYAEDPVRFMPGPGLVTAWQEPSGPGVRVDSGYRAGDTVTPYYDPLLAKLVVHGADRAQALERARTAVAGFTVAGPKCNLPFFPELLADPEFVAGTYDTGIVERMRARPPGPTE